MGKLNDTIKIRLEEGTKKKLSEISKENRRDLSDFIRFILMNFVELKRPAQIAIIEILKHGTDKDFAKFICDFVLYEIDYEITENKEYDKIFYRRIRKLVKGE